jgi:hypothetical protein
MKKGIIILFVVIGLIITIAMGYLMYKTWSIFGFWTLAWTFVVNFFSGMILGGFIGSRKETDGKIIYNPRELPKMVSMSIGLLIGYYLYTIISTPNISTYDYYFGLTYLILLTFVPILWNMYKIIRDRNDYVEISGNILIYKDNSDTGNIDLSLVKKVEGAGDIRLTFNDDSSAVIKLSKMNFNSIDQAQLVKDINDLLPKTELPNA